jgi:cytochrome c biogenesis protein CcdA/thiol-disulfide isomerase/thioredoxin
MVLFLISFLAGILTVLSPCVLPLLPVIVGGSVVGGTRRAYTICISLGLAVVLFTVLLKASTVFISVPQAFWQIFSGTTLVLFGVVMLFPAFWDSLPFVNTLNRSSNKALAAGYQKNSFWGDVIMGASLGPVFSSCSPTYFVVLATVLPASFGIGLTDLLAYAVGLSGLLFIISLAGQRLVDALGVTIESGGWFRRALGVIFIVLGIAVAFGTEASSEVWLYDHGFDVTVIEQQLLGANNTSASGAHGAATTSPMTAAEKALVYQKAPELAGIDGYINTNGQPITIGQFKGKDVVLIDFWTYSCINCIRTVPYVESWYQKYKDEGLVIVGVHTPEFAFEHVTSNVEQAVKQLGITYPVVQDNEYSTWNAFGNQFWPREYLIDIDGFIVHDHAGEGDYDGTEMAIRQALAERAARLGGQIPASTSTPTGVIPMNESQIGSPETYFGSARNEYLGSGRQGVNGIQTLSEPQSVLRNTLYLIGKWDFADQYAETPSDVGSSSVGSDRVDYLYDAKNVYFVAGSAAKPIEVEVLRDSKPLTASEAGKDVYFKDGRSYVSINENRLYDIVKGEDYSQHLLEIIISHPGLQAYTFTFG